MNTILNTTKDTFKSFLTLVSLIVFTIIFAIATAIFTKNETLVIIVSISFFTIGFIGLVVQQFYKKPQNH